MEKEKVLEIEITKINDVYDKLRYNLGNYFKTKEEVEKIINSKEWKDFWAKVRAGEIGGRK